MSGDIGNRGWHSHFFCYFFGLYKVEIHELAAPRPPDQCCVEISVRKQSKERTRESRLRRAGRWALHARPRRSVCGRDQSPSCRRPVCAKPTLVGGAGGQALKSDSKWSTSLSMLKIPCFFQPSFSKKHGPRSLEKQRELCSFNFAANPRFPKSPVMRGDQMDPQNRSLKVVQIA